MTFKLLESGIGSAASHMARDSSLLDSLSNEPSCLLHFYEWQAPSATYGYFCRPEQLLNMRFCQEYPLELAKRPTGGGITFHQFDLAFSVLLTANHPRYCLNTLESYCSIHSVLLRVIARFQNTPSELLQQDPMPLTSCCGHFCMAKPTIYDLVICGRKVAGGAQRRTKKGILHQGTIALTLPKEEFLSQILLPNTSVMQAMHQNSHPLLGLSASCEELAHVRQRLKFLLHEEFAAFASA